MTFLLRFMLGLALASVLAACGGSDSPAAGSPEAGAAPIVFVEPAWASPAMLVPPGQDSVSIALTGCLLQGSRPRRGDEIMSLETPLAPIISGATLYSASLVVSSEGSLSLVAATATTATLSTVTQWLTQDAEFAELSVLVSGGTVTSLELRAANEMDEQGFLLVDSAGNHSLVIGGTNRVLVSCSGSGSVFQLKNFPSDARIKTRFVPPEQTSTLSWGVSDSSSDGIEADDSQVIIHLNQANGSFSLSTSGTSTITPLSLLVTTYIGNANANFSYTESVTAEGIGLKVTANVSFTPLDDIRVALCRSGSVISPQACAQAILN
jgi:hypothetical protein